jgi:hypothetical protein
MVQPVPVQGVLYCTVLMQGIAGINPHHAAAAAAALPVLPVPGSTSSSTSTGTVPVHMRVQLVHY